MKVAVLLAAVAVFAAPAGAATRSSLATGVVDVATNLGYQNGSAAGTGVVLEKSGEVLTNNHVIRGATSIHVTDPSTGHTYTATVVGYSVANDLAVLQLQGASNLKTITTGDSSKLRVGQHVTAVGNAEGRGGTPSEAGGSVTALGRTIVATDGDGISEQLTGLIKTDAALQPGDSGGPLVDGSGRVVGIDTAASRSGGFYFQQSASEGYAIPINKAVALAKQAVAGRASVSLHLGSTPFLGVSIQSNGGGAEILDVVPGSPADKLGLGPGDLIVSVDGKQVASYSSLTSLLLGHHAGDTVTVNWVDSFGTAHTATVKTASGPPL